LRPALSFPLVCCFLLMCPLSARFAFCFPSLIFFSVLAVLHPELSLGHLAPLDVRSWFGAWMWCFLFAYFPSKSSKAFFSNGLVPGSADLVSHKKSGSSSYLIFPPPGLASPPLKLPSMVQACYPCFSLVKPFISRSRVSDVM